MKALLISDAIGLGIMEVRPEPAWLSKFTILRNKDILAPDYGAMHVVANLKKHGFPVKVINLVADLHSNPSFFHEKQTDPEKISKTEIGNPEKAYESRKYLFDSIDKFQPGVILFPLSIYNLALYHRMLLSQIKSAFPDSVLVTGGIYATMHAQEILEDGAADVVVRGEGELTTLELFAALKEGRSFSQISGISYRKKQKIIHNPLRNPISDLNSLPHLYTVSEEFNIKARFKILSEVNPEDDFIPGSGFLTSRGCPEACSFCLDPAINHGRVRFHSPEYVENVLSYCAERFPSKAFFFGDATFTMNKKRLFKILKTLAPFPYSYQIQTRADYLDREITEALARARFTRVAIGAESFNQKILQEVARKRLDVSRILTACHLARESGMQPLLTFIVGLPGESKESVWRTVEILKENKLKIATFFPLVVFKGTALFETFKTFVGEKERERLRLNPASEEFFFISEEFPSAEELTSFTTQVNREILSFQSSDPSK